MLNREEKQEKALKIIKMLKLANDPQASLGEIQNAKLLIEKWCKEYHFRIEGNKIIDTDIEFENAKRNMLKLPKEEAYISPYKTNCYVIYKGNKYYQRGKGGPVPKGEYIKQYLK